MIFRFQLNVCNEVRLEKLLMGVFFLRILEVIEVSMKTLINEFIIC